MPTMPWPTMPTVPFGPTVLGYARSAYESESICTAAGSMHDVKNFITTSWQTRLCLMLRAMCEGFSKWGSHLGQPFSAIPHPIVPRFSPLEPQFIPTIQVFLRIWKFVAVGIWERKVCDDVTNFGQILAYFWGSCPPGARQPQNMGCVRN